MSASHLRLTASGHRRVGSRICNCPARLLWPVHDGLPRDGPVHPTHQPGSVALRLPNPADQARPGDLIFFAGTDGITVAPDHVGIVVNPATHTVIDAYANGYPVEYDAYGLPTSIGSLLPAIGFACA
jgi:hypothetical protein